MTDEEREAVRLASIRLMAQAEERDQEHDRREAEREGRRLQAMLDEPFPPVDWTRFNSPVEMNAREFSEWCDRGKPRLGLFVIDRQLPAPPPPPAPSRQKRPQLSPELAARLGEVNGRILGAALASRDARIAELEGRLKAIESALISKTLQGAEPLDLPALPWLKGRDAH